ncbi:MAG TPA: protein kinase, partial [Gammaproteobacteria bacterium]
MSNNRPVGLWMLPAHVGASRSTLAALQRDFNRLRALDHPHIARMLELGNNGKQYYVTGERLDGESLRDVLTHLLPERLDVGEADDIVRAIGSALAYAHALDVAHGDVRAENVVVTMDRRFVLTNFLARRVAKVSGRPPREGDDLKGLARLAAELYTGSTSPQALRAAAHGEVPAARLNAIRAVLEGSGRRPSNVAEFLDRAGLALSDTGATLRRPELPPSRSWSLWRLVVPMAAVAVLASLAATH